VNRQIGVGDSENVVVFDTLLTGHVNGGSAVAAYIFLSRGALLETFLDGIFTAADDKQVTVLIGLDLSAASDTVDHRLLLDRLRLEFGVWFQQMGVNLLVD